MIYSKWANVITTDLATGNAIAAVIDPDDGSSTFGVLALRSIGSTGGATAWCAGTPLTEAGAAFFAEFAGEGPYPLLAAAGVADVPALKEVLRCEYGESSVMRGRLWTFVGEQGYEKIAGVGP